MSIVMAIYGWIMSHGLLFAALYGASEALGSMPSVKSNAVYQIILKALGFLKDKTAKPAAPEAAKA